MRFVCDECVSATLIDALQQADCDVLDIAMQNPGARDKEILERSVREKRVIITHDYDFGDLIFRDGEPAFGVVIITIAKPEDLMLEARQTARLLVASYDMLVNHLTIFTAKGLRQRRISKSI